MEGRGEGEGTAQVLLPGLQPAPCGECLHRQCGLDLAEPPQHLIKHLAESGRKQPHRGRGGGGQEKKGERGAEGGGWGLREEEGEKGRDRTGKRRHKGK